MSTARLLIAALCLLSVFSLTRCAPIETGAGGQGGAPAAVDPLGTAGHGGATSSPASTGPGHFCFAGGVGGHCYAEGDGG